MVDKIVERTERGFEFIEFDDRYGDKCQLQQSSLAKYEQPGTSAVWLGLKSDRMHLDREQVEWLIRQLSLWLETGSFREEQEVTDGSSTVLRETQRNRSQEEG